MPQSPSIYKSARMKTIYIISEKSSYVLDYREILSSPKIRKNNEQFNSCYCCILFDYCNRYVSNLYTIYHTIKFNSECERVFHVSYTVINKNDFLNCCKKRINMF